MTVVEGERSPPTLRRWCGQAECDASIQEKRLLVASCVDTILGEVHLVVTSQRCHGNTAGECEDEDHCGYKGLHGWPRWCTGGMALDYHHRRRPRKKRA